MSNGIRTTPLVVLTLSRYSSTRDGDAAPDQLTDLRPLGTKQRTYIPLCITLALTLLPQLLVAQFASAPGLSASKTSDPGAIAAVDEAITALGGKQALQQFGGATTQVTISSPKKTPYTVNWTDDWSSGHVRFRRDRPGSNESAISLVGSDSGVVRVTPAAKSVPFRTGTGIVALAMSYPGVALVLSLSPQYACTFHTGDISGPNFGPKDTSAGAVLITELCHDNLYPHDHAPIVWKF